MKSAVPPFLNAADWERSSDDVEDLLRAYFHAQLPQPWPELQLPAASKPLPPTRSLWSSRSALAAAVAFLLLGSMALSAAFHGTEPPRNTTQGAFTADRDPLGLSKQLPDAKQAR